MHFFSKTNLKSTYFEDINFSFVILGHALYFFSEFLKSSRPTKLAWNWHGWKSIQCLHKEETTKTGRFTTLLTTMVAEYPILLIQANWFSYLVPCTLTKSVNVWTRVLFLKSVFRQKNNDEHLKTVGGGKVSLADSLVCTHKCFIWAAWLIPQAGGKNMWLLLTYFYNPLNRGWIKLGCFWRIWSTAALAMGVYQRPIIIYFSRNTHEVKGHWEVRFESLHGQGIC